MQKSILTLLVILSNALMLSAQKFVQVATGAGYGKQAYYTLSSDALTSLANESWDLAFSVVGSIDVGVSINESTTSTSGAPAPELELYLTSASRFADTITSAKLGKRLYNDENSWLDGGALNTVADSSNAFDFGWGLYNFSNHTLVGNRVFAIKLRNGSYKKLMIQSFASGTYNLKYANFDGSDEKTVAIKKADFKGSGVALFSFSTGATLPALGAWDLMFGRYVTPLFDGQNTIAYPVTGVLSAPNVKVAEIKGVNPATVVYSAYKDSLKTKLDIIGYDWKTFSFTAGWVIPDDLSFLVQTADNHIYKLVFVDFEGSTTGISTFEKTDLGTITSVNSLNSNFKAASVYPNPVIDEATVAFTLKQGWDKVQLLVQDVAGHVLWTTQVGAQEGLNAVQLPALNLPQGMYFLSIGNGKDRVTLKLMQR